MDITDHRVRLDVTRRAVTAAPSPLRSSPTRSLPPHLRLPTSTSLPSPHCHHGRPRLDPAKQVSPAAPADQCSQTHFRPLARQHHISRCRSGCHPREPRPSSPERCHLRFGEATVLYQVQRCPRLRCQCSSGPGPPDCGTGRVWWAWYPNSGLQTVVAPRRGGTRARGRSERFARP
jgi:hypothetical protein